MEIAVLFSFGLIAALVILPVLTFVKVNNIAYEIEELKRLVSNKHVQKDKAARPEAAPCHVDAPATPVVPAVPKRQADLPRPIVPCEESESRVDVKTAALMADELPTAMDIFWTKIEDWFCVRGSFAPEGMTREFAVATRWLVRMGIILVTGSVVYFAKLSIDRGWMGPTGRVVAMVSCGAAACIAGVWLTRRTRYGIIGHALAALGSTALYLGFGLGHRFFDPPVISSAGIAFAALVGVTIASGVMSVALKSSVIAVMSLVGGYLVPLIAPCGGESPLPLCAYMLLLNAGAFLVARMRGWSMLDFLAAAAAYLISFNWCIHNASASSTAHTEMLAALAAVHALYMASVVAGANARGKAGNIIAWAGLAANACTLFGWISTCFRGHFSNEAAGGVVLALSAAYLTTAYFVRRQGRADAQTINILAFFGVAFLAISPLMILGVRWCCVSWSVLAAVMASAERRTDMKMFGWMAQITLLAAAMVGLFNIAPMEYYAEADAASASYWRNLALRAVRLWTLPASAVWISRRTRSFGWLLSAAGAVAFLFYSCEAWRFAAVFLPSFKHGAVTLAWTLAAFTGVWYGLSARLKAYRLAGLVLLGVSAAKLLFIDTRQLATPAHVAAFAVVGALFIVGAFLYIRFKERFEDKKD
jgi:uncharacterized membrane protein